MKKRSFSDKITVELRRKKIKRFYRINQYIEAPKVRVISEKGEQIGVIKLDEALFKARQQNLDLVEVAEKAKPPVCKIIDFKKFKYQESKKEQAGKRKNKQQDVKEFRFTPFIAQNDFEMRVKRAKKTLEGENKVKLTVKFVGRQMTRKEFGQNLLVKAIDQLKEISVVETAPKWQGRLLSTVLKPVQRKESN